MSVTAVLSRMAAIEARFGTATAPRGTAATTSGTSFDAVLGAQLAGTPAIDGGSTGDAAGFGEQIVSVAREYLGVPYVWGGTDPTTGLDCSGFVGVVLDRLGVDVPRVSRDQATAGQPVASLAEARPGDLLFFNSPVSHVGIYLGGNQMIHAAGNGLDVRITDVYETPTQIRRIEPPASSSSAAGAAVAGAGQYASLFTSAGVAHGVDPALLAAVAQVESGMNPNAVSPAGAQGLMQLMPGTAAGLGVTNAFDPAEAIDGAARLLRSHLERFGTVELALAAYNAGAGAVSRHGGIPPYPETQAYVRRVLDRYGATT